MPAPSTKLSAPNRPASNRITSSSAKLLVEAVASSISAVAAQPSKKQRRAPSRVASVGAASAPIR